MTEVQEASTNNGGPRVVHKGRYTLYETANKGLHLVYQRDDTEAPDHMEIPGPMVALFNAAAAGKLSPTEMFREVMKMRGSMLHVRLYENSLAMGRIDLAALLPIQA